MDERITNKIQTVFAWSAIICLVFYAVGWGLLGKCYPAPSAAFSAQEMTNFYVKHRSSIMVGQVIALTSVIFYFFWTAQITVQMWRRERTPVLAITQLIGGTLTCWVGLAASANWILTAEFAGQVDPEITRMLHFQTWYMYMLTYHVSIAQFLPMGLMALFEKTKPALFPRWTGWVTIVMCISWLLIDLIPFYKTGPFAVDGYINLYHAMGIFFIYCFWMSKYTIADVKRIKISPTQAMAQADINFLRQ